MCTRTHSLVGTMCSLDTDRSVVTSKLYIAVAVCLHAGNTVEWFDFDAVTLFISALTRLLRHCSFSCGNWLIDVHSSLLSAVCAVCLFSELSYHEIVETTCLVVDDCLPSVHCRLLLTDRHSDISAHHFNPLTPTVAI